MKIIHRIVFRPDKTQRRVLQEIGIPVPSNEDLPVFEFDEEHEKLISLKPYIDKWQLVDNVRTEFTKKELDAASFLRWFPLWMNGYPMPDDDFGYIGTTFQKQGYCEVCGSGLVQQSSFRLRKAPNWGSKKIFGLNWVYDEVFVRKDVYETVFKKYGIESMPVLLYKKDVIIEDTVQLIIPTTDAYSNLEEQPYEICKTCGMKRYNPKTKGFFPSFKDSVTGLHLFKGREWFGSGAMSYKQIFVSQELRQEMIKYQIKSDFDPVNQ